jgi:hypothetical protein
MATQTPPIVARSATDLQEIKIVSHSNLFYWWPLWVVGFIMALLTWIDGRMMAIVPHGTIALRDATVTKEQTYEHRDVLVAPQGERLPPRKLDEPHTNPHLRMATNTTYGVIYSVVLILLIIITNVPLRGMWSVTVIMVIIFLTIIFALADWWPPILDALGRLHIHINAAGYLLISVALFAIWLITLLLFDPQLYMVFTPGQLRVHQEIGGGETAYDTAGMVIMKQRNDLFRHWILGLGSGDLIVNTSGATAHHFDLPNVLFVGYKVRQIENMLREKPVVQGVVQGQG